VNARRDVSQLEQQWTDATLVGIRGLSEQLDVSAQVIEQGVAAGADSGTVPRMFRINGQIRFRQQDIDEWINQQETK